MCIASLTRIGVYMFLWEGGSRIGAGGEGGEGGKIWENEEGGGGRSGKIWEEGDGGLTDMGRCGGGWVGRRIEKY